MNVSDLPLVLFLLLPGFLTINIAFLVGQLRRLSTFQATLWSLVVSLLLLAIIYPGYLYIVDSSPAGTERPDLLKVLVNPILVPSQVWVLLYAFALLTGILYGVADRKGLVERVFLWVGIDLNKRGDIWSHQIQKCRLCPRVLERWDYTCGLARILLHRHVTTRARVVFDGGKGMEHRKNGVDRCRRRARDSDGCKRD